MPKLTWEQIDYYHQRAKVPGGWLVKAYEDVTHDGTNMGHGMVNGWDWRVTMCFLPDPQYRWR